MIRRLPPAPSVPRAQSPEASAPPPATPSADAPDAFHAATVRAATPPPRRPPLPEEPTWVSAFAQRLETLVPALAKEALTALDHAEKDLSGWSHAAWQRLERAVVTEATRFLDTAPASATDSKDDGHLLGANGASLPVGSALSDVAPLLPSTGSPARTVVFVNGVGVDVAEDLREAQALANAEGVGVVCVHNATEGLVRDVAQSLGDKYDLGDNHAVDAVVSLVQQALAKGEPLQLVAHSQGALVLSRALQHVSDALPQTDRARLLGLVHVQTFGGAARHYPDGPVYEHNLNTADLVPMLCGLGSPTEVHPGAGAVVNRFFDNRWSVLSNHLWHEVYLDQRYPAHAT
jgi:hypothetical protein